MPRIKVTGTINAPIDRVNAALDDFANTYKFHPIVEHSRSTNGQRHGKGARRMCKLYNGQEVHEQLIESASGRWLVNAKDFGPVSNIDVVIQTRELGANRSEVTYDMNARVRFPYQIMAPMMKMQFGKMIRALIKGLDEHLTTGRLVEKGGKLGEKITPAGEMAAA